MTGIRVLPRHLFKGLITVCVLMILAACGAIRSGSSSADVSLTPEARDSISFQATVLIEIENIDFSRYAEPAACERAIYHIEQLVSGEASGREIINQQADTLSDIAKRLGVRCLSQVRMEQLDQNQLFFLNRVALLINDEELAVTAFRLRLARADGETARAALMSEGVVAFLNSRPRKVATAELIVRELDKLGDSARLYRMLANHSLLGYYSAIFDTLKIRQTSEKMIAMSAGFNATELNQWARIIHSPYFYLASLRLYTQGAVAANNFLMTVPDSIQMLGSDRDKVNFASVRQRYNMLSDMYGSVAMPLTGDVVVSTGDNPHRPTQGKVSLTVSFDKSCTGLCSRRYEVIHRLDSLYRNRPFEITFVAKTVGFSYPPGVQGAAEEMDTIANVFRRLELPGALFITETEFFTREDGRRFPMPTPFEERYLRNQAVLVDKLGLVRWVGSIDPVNESALMQLIARLM